MVLYQQVSALLDFLELHPQLALGRRISRTLDGRTEARRLWAECASIVNSVADGCQQKTPEEWRIYYNEYKSRLIKKSRARIKNGDPNDTDGGDKWLTRPLEFSPLQERLLGLLEREGEECFPRSTQSLDPPDCKKEFVIASNLSMQSGEDQMPSPQSPGSQHSSAGSSTSSYRTRPKKRPHLTIDIPPKEVAPPLDRYDYMAKTWAETLRILPSRQRIIAEKVINEVFFEAQLNTLTRRSHLKIVKKVKPDEDQILS